LSLEKGRPFSISFMNSMKAVILVLFVGGSARAANDSVSLESGETVKGEISRETFKGINIGPRSIAKAQVAPDGIVYDKKPDQLTRGQDSLRGRDYKAAHRGFQAVIQLCEAASAAAAAEKDAKAAKGAKKPAAKPAPKSAVPIRPIFYQHALWGEAQTFAEEGDSKEAGVAIANLIKAFPESWYLQEALLLKVRLAGEDPAAFDAAATEAIKQAGAAGAGSEIGDQINLLKAENLVRKGSADEAQKVYASLRGSSVKRVADASKLAMAMIQLDKDPVQAKITFNDLLNTSKDRMILCGAARGLGDALVKEMKGDKTMDGLRLALESYLRAEVVYFPARGDPTEAHQAALLSGAQCSEQISQMASKDKKSSKVQEGFRTLAKDLYKELKAVYPKSEGARKSEAALSRLQGQ
jgi:hypothetical protein